MAPLQVTYIPVKELTPYHKNSRTHSDAQVEAIVRSIQELGWTTPLLVTGTGTIVAGHGRLMAAQKLGMHEVPCLVFENWTEAQQRLATISDNKIALDAGWDFGTLQDELDELATMGVDLTLTGFSLGELENIELLNDGSTKPSVDYDEGEKGSMQANFIAPPFSVLDSKQGYWKERKKWWLGMGIKSELGRDLDNTNASHHVNRGSAQGGSVFDPVMCEIAYTWFSPVGGTVLDCFAGGSVRGVVASKLGRQYVGVELRSDQVEANKAQAAEICSDPQPVWINGDSTKIGKLAKDVEADLLFSCPPYADLEVYSNDPADISNMPYAEFLEAYRTIIAESCKKLKPNSFAVFVVGEVRGPEGTYYNFVGDTVQAFLDAGLEYYNEAILCTSLGSLPLRAGTGFKNSRKLGKAHQNVLVFVKGDAKAAADACGPVNVMEMPVESESE